MKQVKPTTQQGQRFINEYNNAYNKGVFTLDKAYKTRVSDAKERIFKKCKDYQREQGGRSGVILSSNTYTFTFGFIVNNDLIVITKENYYIIKNCM